MCYTFFVVLVVDDRDLPGLAVHPVHELLPDILGILESPVTGVVEELREDVVEHRVCQGVFEDDTLPPFEIAAHLLEEVGSRVLLHGLFRGELDGGRAVPLVAELLTPLGRIAAPIDKVQLLHQRVLHHAGKVALGKPLPGDIPSEVVDPCQNGIGKVGLIPETALDVADDHLLVLLGMCAARCLDDLHEELLDPRQLLPGLVLLREEVLDFVINSPYGLGK